MRTWPERCLLHLIPYRDGSRFHPFAWNHLPAREVSKKKIAEGRVKCREDSRTEEAGSSMQQGWELGL